MFPGEPQVLQGFSRRTPGVPRRTPGLPGLGSPPEAAPPRFLSKRLLLKVSEWILSELWVRAGRQLQLFVVQLSPI